MIALLLLGASKIVTLDVRASPLQRALPEIGRAFGVNMRATSAIGDELAIFALRGADLAGFKAWTARTFSAEWTTDKDGTLFLNRSAKLRAAESERLRQERLAAVKRWRAQSLKSASLDRPLDAAGARALREEIDRYVKRPEPTEPSAAYYAEAAALNGRLPGERAYARVLSAFPDELFIGTLSPSRTVYSSRPVGAQLPLPFDPAPILSAYAAEQNAWADATADLPPSTYPRSGRIPIVLGRRGEPAGAIPLMVFSVNVNFGVSGAELTLYEGNGRRAVRVSGFVGSTDFDGPAERRANLAATKFPVSYTPESKAFAAVHFPEDDKLSDPGGIKPYVSVRQRDPLSYGASDGLFALARAKNKSLVARAADDLAWVFKGKADGDASLTAMSYFGFETSEEGEWIAVAPENPERAALETIPRDRLEEMLRIADRTGLREIEDVAALATLFPDPVEEYALSKLYMDLFPLWPRFGLERWALLGKLTDGEKSRAMTVDGLPISALNAEARAVLTRDFGLRRDLWFLPESPADAGERERVERGTGSEPSIVLANGFPPESRLRLRETRVDAIRFGEGRWASVLTPEEYAVVLDRQLNPARYPDDEPESLPQEGLVVVKERRLELSLRFNRLTGDLWHFRSETRPPGGPYTRDALPSPIREAVARAVADLAEKNRTRPKTEAPGREVPPPR